MPAMALSRVGARVVESGPDGENLAAGTWQRLEALPDPRSPRGRIYPLACLIAVAVCAFTAAGERPVHRSRAVDQAGWPGRSGPAACSVGPAGRPVGAPDEKSGPVGGTGEKQNRTNAMC
jgi:hypothetical protein